jgi:hypothetical protein
VSDVQQGPGWWQASDGKWYAPEQHPNYQPPPPPPPPPPVPPTPTPRWWQATDGQWYPPESHPNYRAPIVPAQPTGATPAFGVGGPGSSFGAESPNQADSPKTKHTGLIVAGSIVGVLILIIIIVNVANKKSTPTAATSPPASGPAPSAAPATSPAPTAPPTTAPPAVPVVLWQSSGSGIQSGPQFTVPAGTKEWDEVWSYDCSAFGSSGNFISTINGFGSASGTTDSGTNQLGASGSGTNHYYDTGTFSIDVNSECNWTEKAVTVP